jgi:mannose-6-phosphate isomerase-like protein (cupin superfamily)
MRIFLYLSLGLLLTACNKTEQPHKVVFPNTDSHSVKWTTADKQRPIAIRHLQHTNSSSTHLIRLKGNEPPHYHDKHDLNVSLLSGSSILHFKDKAITINAGDVAFIPKGTYHWAENTHDDASIVFAVFSPAFDGQDRRKAE